MTEVVGHAGHSPQSEAARAFHSHGDPASRPTIQKTATNIIATDIRTRHCGRNDAITVTLSTD